MDGVEIPASTDPLDRDRPENIAALKSHIAYVGESQEARMNGVISYIDTIGGSAGAGKLRQIQDDYLAAAATIPVMQTADQINSLRDDMCVQSRLFAEETRAKMGMFNGKPDGMQKAVDTSMNAFDVSLNSMTDPLWLSRESARIVVFNRESQERNFTIRSLKDKGVDITQAQQISDQIDAKRSDLEAALRNNKDGAITKVNTGIKSLNQEFRNTVSTYQTNLEIQMKSVAIMAMSG